MVCFVPICDVVCLLMVVVCCISITFGIGVGVRQGVMFCVCCGGGGCDVSCSTMFGVGVCGRRLFVECRGVMFHVWHCIVGFRARGGNA